MLLLFIVIFLVLICYFLFNLYYKKTSYYQISHKPYLQIRTDIGSFGEYYIYKNLRSLEKNGAKFLFNCYLPRENGTTTEIDVLLLHHSGIYVFESKNYSGWIFGSERSKTWTQMLPQGKGRKARKEHFLNPIFQNELHIKCLKNYIKKDVPMYSIIAFSERCNFKNLKLSSANYNVIHRFEAINIINKNVKQFANSLSDDEISEIYNLLYPCTQVSELVKQQHIDDINNSLNNHVIKENGIISGKKANNIPICAQAEVNKNIDIQITYGEKSEEADENNKHICPKCGAKLIVREVKRGKNKGNSFYGCSNFPQCRYIQNLNN